jgi:hypothetical protein
MNELEKRDQALNRIYDEVAELLRLDLSDAVRNGLDRIQAIARYKSDVVPPRTVGDSAQ